MKRLFIAIISMATIGTAFSQCPGCIIDMGCTGSGPTLCPANLPDGDQGQPYDEDLTFYLPQTFTDAGSGTQVTLQKIVVTGLAGVPAGMFWQTNSPNNTYIVTSDPNTQRGCAKVCGTPTLPGNYNVTVSVIATVNTVIGVQNVPQSFTLPLVVHPSAGGNPYFSFNPSSGCGNASVTYQGLINLGMPQITEYAWDFDNGNTSTVQNPPVQQYVAPGEYHPTLTTNIYDLILTNVDAHVTGGWWQGIWPCNGTSIWFNFSAGATQYSSGTSSSLNPSWGSFSPPIVLASNLVTIDFKQKQGICPTWDGGSYAVQVNGPGVYNFSTTAVSNGGGGVNGTFTIAKQLFESYVAVDTLHVYNLPPLPNIISSSGSFTTCSTSPITLSVYGGYFYEWYMNDTVLLVGQNDASYEIPDPSDYPSTNTYKVRVIDPNTGCSVTSPSVSVTVNEGIPDLFNTFGISYVNGTLLTNYNYPGYQWFLNGAPLFPSGINQTLVPVVNGNYTLVVTNSFGCSDTSNTIAVFNVGINEASILEQYVSIYPNPSHGEFTLNLSEGVSGSLHVSLVDLSGKAIYNEYLGVFNGNYSKTFSLQHLSAGIYTLSIAIDQATVRRKIIIH